MENTPHDAPQEPDADESASMPIPILSAEQETGKIILLVHIGFVIALALFVVASFAAMHGAAQAPARIFRFVLHIALCGWLYQGSPVARWLAIVLYGGTGIVCVVGLATALRAGDDPFLWAILGAMAGIYLSFATVLLASPSVKAFLRYRREARHPPQDGATA